MVKMRFVVEVDANENRYLFSSRPPSSEDIRQALIRHIGDGCGHYPMFDYNTFTVMPLKGEKS